MSKEIKIGLFLLILISVIVVAIVYFVIRDETVGVECNLTTGEGCDKKPTKLCEVGFIFSQKYCSCVPDSFGCSGLEKDICEQNPNCFSFSRGGTCSCPSCGIYLSHQCLPR